MSKTLCDKLYEKIKSEHSQLISELKTKPANDIILSAYEIVIKNEIIMYCENEDSDLTDEQFKYLLSRPGLWTRFLNSGVITVSSRAMMMWGLR